MSACDRCVNTPCPILAAVFSVEVRGRVNCHCHCHDDKEES